MNGIRHNEIVYDRPASDQRSIMTMRRCEGCDARQNYQRHLIDGYESLVGVGDAVSVEMSDQTAATYDLSWSCCAALSGMHSEPSATATNYATGDPFRIEGPLVDFNAGGGTNGHSTASVQGFAVLWITSVDTKGGINGESLDFVGSGEVSRSQGSRGALTSECWSNEDRTLV